MQFDKNVIADLCSKVTDTVRFLSRFQASNHLANFVPSKEKGPMLTIGMDSLNVLASNLEEDPNQIAIVLNEVFKSQDQFVLKSIKELLVVGKLRSTTVSENLSKYRVNLWRLEEQYQLALALHEKAKASTLADKEKYDQARLEKSADLIKHWHEMVSQLQVDLASISALTELDDNTQKFVQILEESSRFVAYEGLTITADWDEVNKFHNEHIAGILRKLLRAKID